MKLSPIPLLAVLILAGALPAWANPAGPCRNVDMYGIYQVCGSPGERSRGDRSQAVVQPVYVTVPQNFAAPMSNFGYAPTPDVTAAPAPPTPDTDPSLRELTTVDARLHALRLLLDDKASRGEISGNFFDEETRYLAQLESREQSAASINGGFLTLEQESSLLQQIQLVENEINQAIANNG